MHKIKDLERNLKLSSLDELLRCRRFIKIDSLPTACALLFRCAFLEERLFNREGE